MFRYLIAALASVVCCAAADPWPQPEKVILDLSHSKAARLRNVPVNAVTIKDGFWSQRRQVNVDRSIPTMLQLLEQHGIVDNFLRVTGAKDAPRKGPVYTDSDIYKWIEGVAYVLDSGPQPTLEADVDRLAAIIVAAQEPSGYLNTYFQDEKKPRRFQEMTGSHELYNLGHLLQAAVAYYRATGKRTLLDAGIRYVEYLIKDFGPDKKPLLTGHPELEMGLIELSRTTGDPRYVGLVAYLYSGVEQQRLKLTPARLTYMFSGRNFTDRTIMEGHAVRAGYACSGATDYYLETGDPAFKKTLDALWSDMVHSKMYVTGGIGSRSEGEAFGDAYELPNATAYTESCAAIANMMWNWRMLHATGEAKYTDVLERALYNSVNSGMSLEGTMYCYRNPLELTKSSSSGIRNPWYETTCCPPNLERTFAELPGYFYSTSKDGLYVHLYDNTDLDWKLESGTPLKVHQRTRYPWDGAVDLTLEPAQTSEFTLYLRIPAWSRSTTIAVNGTALQGQLTPGTYYPLRRVWKAGDTVKLGFDMSPQLITANPLIREDAGRVAVQRGPVVYCLEENGQAEGVTVSAALARLDHGFTSEYKKDVLGGIVLLHHEGVVRTDDLASHPLYEPLGNSGPPTTKPAQLTLTPYYTFQNRGPAAMEVWLPYVK